MRELCGHRQRKDWNKSWRNSRLFPEERQKKRHDEDELLRAERDGTWPGGPGAPLALALGWGVGKPSTPRAKRESDK